MRRKFIQFTIMILALIISGCAPVAANEVSQPPVENAKVVETGVVDESQSTVTPSPPEVALAPSPVAVATSRGDQLAATDPATVDLAAGVPTLVEFFRFT